MQPRLATHTHTENTHTQWKTQPQSNWYVHLYQTCRKPTTTTNSRHTRNSLGQFGAVGTDRNRCSMRMRPTTKNFQHIARHFFAAFRRCSNWSNRKALSNSTSSPGKCYQYWLAKHFLKCTPTHTQTHTQTHAYACREIAYTRCAYVFVYQFRPKRGFASKRQATWDSPLAMSLGRFMLKKKKLAN